MDKVELRRDPVHATFPVIICLRWIIQCQAVTPVHFADHINHPVCQVAGNARHASVGSDTDAQGGAEGAPAESDTVADYPQLAAILAGRGYDQQSIKQVMFRNWQRLNTQWLSD